MSNLKIRNVSESELLHAMKKGGWIVDLGGNGSHKKCNYNNQVTCIPFTGRKNSTVAPKIVKRVYEIMGLIA